MKLTQNSLFAFLDPCSVEMDRRNSSIIVGDRMHVVSHDENLQLGQRNTRNRKLFSSNFFQLNDRKLKVHADDRRDSYCNLLLH